MKPIALLSFSLMALLFSGCVEHYLPYGSTETVRKHPPASATTVKQTTMPQPAPTPAPAPLYPKTQKLKKVEDHNFDPDYMYPETPKRTPKKPQSPQKVKTTSASISENMSKEECIGMIGQTRYDKYTQMLGSEAAAIKRCILLKSMK